MFFATKAQAQRALHACNYVPSLKARHQVVPTTYWPLDRVRPVQGWTIVLTTSMRRTP